MTSPGSNLNFVFFLQGIPLEDFGNAYKKRFKEAILAKSGGFKDVDDLVEAMTRLVYVREDTKGIKKVIPTLARMEGKQV